MTELNVIRMYSLHFELPISECGREDVSIVIEYCKSDLEENSVYCWAWAQVGDAFIRGLVDEYSVEYLADKDQLEDRVISALNNSSRFRESLPGFITSVIGVHPTNCVNL